MFSNIRSFLPFLLSLLFGVLPPAMISSNCGFRGYSFVDPAVIDRINIMTPFILNFESFARQYKRQTELRQEDNIGEWRERFCNRPRTQDISFLIYEASVTQLETLRTASCYID